MRIQKKNKKSNKALILVVTAFAVIVSGTAVYAYTTKSFIFSPTSDGDSSEIVGPKENEVNYDDSTDTQKQNGLDAKQEFIDNNYGDGNDDKSESSLSITSIGPGSGRTTAIRAIVDGLGSSGGSCDVLATGPSDTVRASTDVKSQGSYSVCNGFDLELTPGKWQIEVTYTDVNGLMSKDTQSYEVK